MDCVCKVRMHSEKFGCLIPSELESWTGIDYHVIAIDKHGCLVWTITVRVLCWC